MANFKKIICAIDLNDKYARSVADYACTIAKAFNCDVIVLYVMPSLNALLSGVPVEMNSLENMSANMREVAEANMRPFVAENFKGIKATGKIAKGEAAVEIMEMAKEEKADLIIMGTRGYKGVMRTIFGSVAEKVIKNAHVPVMTISPE